MDEAQKQRVLGFVAHTAQQPPIYSDRERLLANPRCFRMLPDVNGVTDGQALHPGRTAPLIKFHKACYTTAI
ncbi:MAG: hypothetical protein JXB07_08285 [Anaerolineae bacterium]|nr:hypothetical protein [Anaerolineae bacterium]